MLIAFVCVLCVFACVCVRVFHACFARVSFFFACKQQTHTTHNISEMPETQGRCLSLLTWEILSQQSKVLQKFSISPRKFFRFLEKVEEKYDSNNPYHNKTHAADVVNSIAYIFNLPFFKVCY